MCMCKIWNKTIEDIYWIVEKIEGEIKKKNFFGGMEVKIFLLSAIN